MVQLNFFFIPFVRFYFRNWLWWFDFFFISFSLHFLHICFFVPSFIIISAFHLNFQFWICSLRNAWFFFIMCPLWCARNNNKVEIYVSVVSVIVFFPLCLFLLCYFSDAEMCLPWILANKIRIYLPKFVHFSLSGCLCDCGLLCLYLFQK